MACGAIAFQIYATLLSLYISALGHSCLYIVDLGAICSSKLSLLSPPPPPYCLHLSLNLLDLFSFPCTLLCAAPLPTARRPSSYRVLSPSKFAKTLGRSPSLQRQSS